MEELQTVQERPKGVANEDEIQEMIALARRLRDQSGGTLDDDAILAVAEATGAPVDWVRLAIHSVPATSKKETIFDRLKASYLAFSNDQRRMVLGAVIGLGAGVSSWVATFTQDKGGFFGIVTVIAILGALVNAASSRSVRTATASGALSGATAQLSLAFFLFLTNMIVPNFQYSTGSLTFLIWAAAGAFLGSLSFAFFSKNRTKWGFHDPAADRHALIQQLMEIQSQLRSDEKFVTFLSVDMVGSTKIKTDNDPLSVEFTFNEYHAFIQTLVNKHGGKIHSTAGDGVTAVFEDPRLAFQAGKAIQGGLFEFNSFRNKLNRPVELRAGMHTGNILAPGKDSTSVNFAHVIDIAAHMQKVAPVGGLAVSEKSAVYFGGLGAVGEETLMVDELKAAVWRPRMRQTPLAAAVPSDSTGPVQSG